MVRRISQAQLDKVYSEPGSRVLTKKRAAPKVIPTPKEAPKPVQADNSKLIEMLTKQNAELVNAIKNIVPEVKAPDVILESPRIETIYIGNIERNGQNRIESAEMNVKYEGIH